MKIQYPFLSRLSIIAVLSCFLCSNFSFAQSRYDDELDLSDEEFAMIQKADQTESVNWEEDLAPYKSTSFIQDLPSYKFSDQDFYIDKIIHSPTETIFLLRLVFRAGKSAYATFYPVRDKETFFIKPLNKGKKTYCTKVSMIRKSGILIIDELSDFPYRIVPFKERSTVFSCMVHFKKISEDIDAVHLIEGQRNGKNGMRYFNYFGVELERQ